MWNESFKIRRVTAFSFIMLDKIATMMYRHFFVYRIRILFFLPFPFGFLFIIWWAIIKDILYSIIRAQISCWMLSRFFAWTAHRSAEYLRSRNDNSLNHRVLYISFISSLLNSTRFKFVIIDSYSSLPSSLKRTTRKWSSYSGLCSSIKSNVDVVDKIFFLLRFYIFGLFSCQCNM